MNLRYAIDEIRSHWRDITWWRKRFLTHVVSRYYDVRGTDATPVIDEDWDNLIILDACRYDLFEEAYEESPLSGSLSSRTSMDSCTPGFLKQNFQEGTFHDTVYITANPYLQMLLDDGQFHAVDHVWQDGWDEDANTVLPETILDRAITAAEKYPEKRLIIHFMQPHAPFIGDSEMEHRDVFAIRDQALGDEVTRQAPTPFERLDMGEISREQLWKSYRANLDTVLPAVKELLDTLPGRTAVTADHGNALGEWAKPFPVRVYGHPLGIKIPALTKVPWLVSDNGARKTISEEEPDTEESSVDSATEERLRMLGYAE